MKPCCQQRVAANMRKLKPVDLSALVHIKCNNYVSKRR